MKIKKIKSNGLFIYPATIASAVKDTNFPSEDNKVLTLGEINLYLNTRIDDSLGDINSILESIIND